MQVDGDKFLRNLEIEKERAELERQRELLMAQKMQSLNSYKNYENQREFQDGAFQELDDIRLEKETSNKQKYILLGFILVLLFLITIVVVKLYSDPKKETEFAPQEVVQEEVTPAPQPLDQNATQNENETNESKPLDIDKIIQSADNLNTNQATQTPQVATNTNETQGDIFGIEKKDGNQNNQPAEKVQPQPQVTKVVEQPIEKPVQKPIQKQQAQPKTVTKEAMVIKEPVKKQTQKPKEATKKIEPKEEKKDLAKLFPTTSQKQTPQTGAISIQVGAFSSAPDPKLLEGLKSKNFSYTMKKVEVNGKQMTKLFVGSYKTKEQALQDLAKIKQDFNPNAFIKQGE